MNTGGVLAPKALPLRVMNTENHINLEAKYTAENPGGQEQFNTTLRPMNTGAHEH
jgi:hypothetical protein